MMIEGEIRTLVNDSIGYSVRTSIGMVIQEMVSSSIKSRVILSYRGTSVDILLESRVYNSHMRDRKNFE